MLEPHEQDTTLTPARFARVRAVFEAAVERPAGERRAFVEGACGDDGVLRREVLGMLATEGKQDPLLDPAPASSAPEEGRFPAGTVLAGRYRILGLLGKGGMGEVYKAFDLILNQTVALKFLAPAHLGEAALARFRNEVRIARQVSHAHVCRVYDLGMVEGLHFLSMEFIDGEDLSSLLRRIGRLPQDKAIEFTRKICAGLSAAHERGVLHRDLKPANIMIDGRGQPRITDFGLAALAQEIPLSDLRSGTPAYMSPEQKAGKDVTTRSDIYSLGLVLHEMFTGKARKDTQSAPSELVKDLDPAIERLILRCLEEEPKRRPQTALNVAMALPGADPIAAALAAGETPSPEMVAASTEKEGFSARTAALCFAGIAISIAVFVLDINRIGLLARAPLDVAPEVLAFRAQEILRQLGYTEKPRSTVSGFDIPEGTSLGKLQGYNPGRREQILASHQPAVIRFWYRQHQGLFRVNPSVSPVGGAAGYDSPPNTEPGMIRVSLDPTGRLTGLEARPPAARAPEKQPPPDWNTLLTLAGLDPNRFTPAVPAATPPMAIDEAFAWTGTYAEDRPEQVHVEAAAWQGRPVFLAIATPASSPPAGTLTSYLEVAFAAIVLGAAFQARRNLQLGRGDRRAAAVVAGTFFLSGMLLWSLTATHVADIREGSLLIGGISYAGFGAGLMWISYLAIEPQVRRHWPDSLISWTRLTNGRLRDPLVASHILAGVLAGSAVQAGLTTINAWVLPSKVPYLPSPQIMASLSSPAFSIHVWVAGLLSSFGITMAFVLLIVLLRLLGRRMWIADGLAMIATITVVNPQFLNSVFFLILALLVAYIYVGLLRRFGVLALWMIWFATYPVGVPVLASSWYSGRALIAHLVPVALAAWALWVILSAQKRPSTESVA